MRCLEITKAKDHLRTRVVPPALKDRYYPSADRLFASAAKVCPERSVGVILTGMADDGTAGALELRKAGGHIICESEETAVVYGMPRSAIEAGAAHQELPLSKIAGALLSIEARTRATMPPV
jgi:two-component system chemotaxis response regulator CheB